VNAAYRRNGQEEMKGYLGYSEEELVSMDYKGSLYSGVVDAPLTTVIGDFMVKVLSWYDNEWGYACRVAHLVNYMAPKGVGRRLPVLLSLPRLRGLRAQRS